MFLGRPYPRRQVNLAIGKVASIGEGAQRSLVAGLVAAGLLGSILIVFYGPASFGNYANSKPPVPREQGDERNLDRVGPAPAGVRTGSGVDDNDEPGSTVGPPREGPSQPLLAGASGGAGARRGTGMPRGIVTSASRGAGTQPPTAHLQVQAMIKGGGEGRAVVRTTERPTRPVRAERAPGSDVRMADPRSQTPTERPGGSAERPGRSTDVTVIGGGFREPARILITPGVGRRTVKGGEADRH